MSIFQRLQDVLGLSERYDQFEYVYDYEEDPQDYAVPPDVEPVLRDSAPPLNRASKVIEMPGMIAGQMEVVLMEPRSFDGVMQAIVALRERKAVILNLGLMEPEQAQRSVDYVAGGTFAIDGDQERLGEKVFLFTPGFVRISRPGVPAPTAPKPASASAASQPSQSSPSAQPSQPPRPS